MRKRIISFFLIWLALFLLGYHLFYLRENRPAGVKISPHIYQGRPDELIFFMVPTSPEDIQKSLIKDLNGRIIAEMIPLFSRRPRRMKYKAVIPLENRWRRFYLEIFYKNGFVFRKKLPVKISEASLLPPLSHIQQRGRLICWDKVPKAAYYNEVKLVII